MANTRVSSASNKDSASNLPQIKRLIFVRHAIAVEREDWTGMEAERPLTKKGVRRAQEIFDHVFTLYRPTHLISSPYLRALETAHLIQEAFVQNHPEADPLSLVMTETLLPEASFENWRAYLCQQASNFNTDSVLCAVGHDPSIGEITARHLGLTVSVPFKKAGIAILDADPTLQHCVPRALLTPALVRR